MLGSLLSGWQPLHDQAAERDGSDQAGAQPRFEPERGPVPSGLQPPSGRPCPRGMPPRRLALGYSHGLYSYGPRRLALVSSPASLVRQVLDPSGLALGYSYGLYSYGLYSYGPK